MIEVGDSVQIRGVDDLGRVAIPKDIRKKLRIREGDKVGICVDEGTIVIIPSVEVRRGGRP